MFPTLSFLSLIAKAHLVLIRCVCVRVCACPFAMQPFSLAFCRSGVESFTATHCFTTQSLYFKLSGNSACALVRLCSDSSYKKPQLIFCLCTFQGLLICCNTADFPALMLIAGEDLIWLQSVGTDLTESAHHQLSLRHQSLARRCLGISSSFFFFAPINLVSYILSQIFPSPSLAQFLCHLLCS